MYLELITKMLKNEDLLYQNNQTVNQNCIKLKLILMFFGIIYKNL